MLRRISLHYILKHYFETLFLAQIELQKSAAIVRISEEDIKSISEDLRLKLTPEETSAIYGTYINF